MRTISVDHKDLDNVDEAKEEIIKQIKAVEKKGSNDIETPISVSLELQQLRQSDNPEERSLADIVSTLSELHSDLDSIDKRLQNPEKIFPPEYLDFVFRKVVKRFPLPIRSMEEYDYLLRNMEGILSEERMTAKNKDVLIDMIRRMRHLMLDSRHRELE